MNTSIHHRLVYSSTGFQGSGAQTCSLQVSGGGTPSPSHQYTTIHTHINLLGTFGVPDGVPPHARPWSLGGSWRTPRERAQMQREQEDFTQKWGRWLAAVASNSANQCTTMHICVIFVSMFGSSSHLKCVDRVQM